MAGKAPKYYKFGGFLGEIIELNGRFSSAMVEYRRVRMVFFSFFFFVIEVGYFSIF